MGLLSALGKLGSIALDFVPGGGAAKTGVKIAKGIAKGAAAAGDIGSVGAKQQQGAAEGRRQQELANQTRDRNAVDLYQAQQNAQNQAAQIDMQRKQQEQASQSAAMKSALAGMLLGGGMQPTSIQGGQRSGGLLASLNANPELLAALKGYGQKAQSASMSPMSFSGGQLLAAPKMSTPINIDQGGFLSTLAKVGELAGAASPYLADLGRDKPQSPYITASNGIYGDMLPGQQIAINPPKAKPVYADDEEDWSNR